MSYSQDRRAPLLPPSCTLSTGLTFFNTVSLKKIKDYIPLISTTLLLGLPVLVFNVFSPKYSSLRVNLGIHLQSRFHHQVSHSALDPYVTKTFLFHSCSVQPTCGAQAHIMLTTIYSTPSSIVITGSLFLLTLVRSSFSSLDSTIPTPFHSCSFVPLRSSLQPPQLFRFVPLPSSLLHTQQTNLSRFHIIRQAPSFSRHRPNIQLPTLTQ